MGTIHTPNSVRIRDMTLGTSHTPSGVGIQDLHDRGNHPYNGIGTCSLILGPDLEAYLFRYTAMFKHSFTNIWTPYTIYEKCCVNGIPIASNSIAMDTRIYPIWQLALNMEAPRCCGGNPFL